MPKKKEDTFKGIANEFEHFTDHIIPYLVVGIGLILIAENPFWTLVHLSEYEPWVTIFDSVVVFFFVIDLTFKWYRVKELRKFFALYWLDIIAVFPFYLVFRTYTELASLFIIGEEATEAAQKALHEAALIKEARLIEKEAKIARGSKIFRTVGRFLRIMKGRFYLAYKAFIDIHHRHKREH